jgi:crotonobetainyl-CoA:carnitine CoA-transferase CaiB-like acyl-CoA transferase
LVDWTVNRRSARRPGEPNGNRADFGEMAPHGVYAAEGEDRWVAVACRDDGDWIRLREVIADPVGRDERFATLPGRLADEDELDAIVSRWMRERDAREAARTLVDAGVPASVVKSPDERINEDPDLDVWGLFPTVHHPLMGDVRVEGLPIHLSETDWSADKGGPLLGEDNDRIIGELLGVDPARLERLRADGVV